MKEKENPFKDGKAELIGKWKRTSYGEDLDNYSVAKQKRIAIALENTAVYLRRLTEATIHTWFGLRPEQILNLVKSIAVKSQIDDIFSEVYLINPDEAIYYIDSELKQEEGENKVDIRVNKKRFSCRVYPTGYQFAKLVNLTLSVTGLGNVEVLMERAISDEHVFRKELDAINTALRVSKMNSLHKITHYSDLIKVGGSIHDQVGIGTVNRILCGRESLAIFMSHPLFVENVNGSKVGSAGFILVGSIEDIKIYQTRSGLMDEGYFLAIYKPGDNDPGRQSIVFATMQELVSSMDYPQREGEKNATARIADKLILNPQFIQQVQIVHHKNRLLNWFYKKILKRNLKLI